MYEHPVDLHRAMHLHAFARHTKYLRDHRYTTTEYSVDAPLSTLWVLGNEVGWRRCRLQCVVLHFYVASFNRNFIDSMYILYCIFYMSPLFD